MRITSVNCNPNRTSFTGAKEHQAFRTEATLVIAALDKISPGTGKYTVSVNGEPSLRTRLYHVVFDKAQAIGEKYVTPADRRKHGQLKVLFKTFETDNDLMNAVPGVHHHIDRTLQVSI